MTVIDDIKDRIDIIDVVSETVKLKKSGRTYTGFCPFHANTRTPSFVVWPESGTWKCFGACNTGGDVFTFLMKRDGLEFKDALHELGRRAGVEIIEEHKPEAEIEDQHLARLREAVAAAAQWFNYLLLNNPQAQIARDHLSKRGITAQTIETFQLGYALESWDALHNHLLQKGFSNEELIDAGLLVQRDDGRVFDRFRNRVMIPIHDGKGRPIGFGARALKPGDEPKYLNSPQTALFDKSRTLFALHAARQAIRDQKVAVIVEGYMDALAAHQHGFHNVVASLGTALTEYQFKQLQKLAPKIVLALDPDTAGINAMLRGLDVARETLDREAAPIFNPRGLIGYAGKLQIDIRVLTVPDGKDPDELMEDDPQAWQTLVDNAQAVVPFVIDALSAGRDLNDPHEKTKLSKEVLPIIRDVADPVEQMVYVQQLARRLKVDERAMFDQMRVVGADRVGRAPARQHSRITPVPEAPKRDTTDLEQYTLSLLLLHPHVMNAIDEVFDRAELPALNVDDFEQLACREIFRALRTALSDDPAPTPDAIRANLDEALYPEVAVLYEETNERPPVDRGISLEDGAKKAGLQLREKRLRREGQQLRALLQDTAADTEALEILTQVGRDNAAALLRLQQTLTTRTIGRATDPWGRS
ncbi:MAG TPA: DNA primase [Anaerolineae bacterium]|nr:DNA primase [Anaerolineae bacterium]